MGIPTKRVEIKLGDGTKKRYLRFDFEAICRLREETGEGMDPVLRRAGMLDPLSIIALTWAGLLHMEADLTIKKVRKLINLEDIRELLENILLAVKLGTGQKADADDDDDEEEDGDSGNPEGAAEEESP